MRIRKQNQWKRAYYWTPDHKSRKYAIEMAYKLRGRYEAEKVKFVDPYEGMKVKELLEKWKLIVERIAQMKNDGQSTNSGSQICL